MRAYTAAVNLAIMELNYVVCKQIAGIKSDADLFLVLISWNNNPRLSRTSFN